MRSSRWLANRLLISPDELLALGDEVQAGRGWRALRIRKRRGGYRDVVIADPHLLWVLKKLLTVLYESPLPISPAAYGFVPKRSIVDHARHHLAQPALAHLDIQDFFSSISRRQVSDALAGGFDEAAVEALLKVVTIDGCLPQGLPTSPYLSNLVFVATDQRITEIAARAGLAYSRYADDITISGIDVVAAQAEIAAVLAEQGWSLNPAKTRIQKRGQRQYVTGLTVFDDERPRLARRLKRRYRLKLHLIETYGYDAYYYEHGGEEAGDHPRALFGMLRYMMSIEPAFAAPLFEKLESYVDEDAFMGAEDDWDADLEFFRGA